MPRHYDTYDYFIVPIGDETNSRIVVLIKETGGDPDRDQVNLHLGPQHTVPSFHVLFETMLVIWFTTAKERWIQAQYYRVSKKTGAKSSVPLKTFEDQKNSPKLRARLDDLKRKRVAALRQMAPYS